MVEIRRIGKRSVTMSVIEKNDIDYLKGEELRVEFQWDG